MKVALAPLRHRDFRLLFLGRLTSLAGSAVAHVAAAFAVLEIGGSAGDLGLVLAAGTIPQLLFLLVGGVVADRLPRHVVMVAADVVSGLVQLTVAMLVITGRAEIWQLAVLNMLRGSASAFFAPASSGITPQTVPAAELQSANALLRLTNSATQVLGAMLGGLLVAAVGPGWALAWDGVTYLAGGAFIAAMRVRAATRTAGSSFLAELREGWSEFSSRTWLWAIVAAASLGNMAFGMGWIVLGPVVAEERLGGAAAWGFISATGAIGFVVGGLIALRIRPRRILRIAVAFLLVSCAGMMALALGLPVWGVALASLVTGLGLEIFSVFWDLSLQQQIPNDRLSRVSAYDWLGSLAALPIGMAIAGPLADAVGIENAIWIAVGLWTLPNLFLLTVKDVRTLERTDLEPALST